MKYALKAVFAAVLLTSFVLLAACSTHQEGGTNEQGIENQVQSTPNEVVNEAQETEDTAAEEVEEQQPPVPLILTDGMGREITLDAPAQRVVGLAPSIVEILFAVGAGDQVVGREEFTNYPEEAISIPSVGGSFGELNTEAILALEPDLVLVANLTSPEQVQALEDLGLVVFLVPNPIELDGMYDSLRTVAALTGHNAEAEDLIGDLQVRVEAVEDVISLAADAPLVFYQLDSTDPTAPYTSGPGTFIDTLITMAGGLNVGSFYEGQWVQMSSEEIIAKNPDVIILGDSIWGMTVDEVSARPGWDAIAAVQNGKVFPFNDDLASRPGPRLVDGLEEMAKLIHPELFD